MQIDQNLPVYPIGVAAKLLDVHPRTLRIYEEEGLIKPHREGGKRLYSQTDVEWIQCIRKLIHEENISIPGLKKLLEVLPCWRIKDCPEEVRYNCKALKEKDKNCWELAQNACDKACLHCETFISQAETASQ